VKLLHALYLLLAALWCGALLSFAFGAGIVLRTSPSRQAGGTVNRALLDVLDVSSYAVVGVLLVLFLAVERRTPFRKLPRALTFRLFVVVIAATLVSHLLVTPEMVALRDRMGTAIDLVPKSDPLRMQWGRLHALSALALLLRIVCGLGLFGLGMTAQPEGKRSRSGYQNAGSRPTE
jgi:hypothetical protein